nr:MalY/PatB family protein [Hoyosella altamirensis]
MTVPRRNPLTELSLDQLRARTSVKWRTHPSDVLPLWVAEMDTPLAPAVAQAIREAVDIGDTGYPAGNVYGEALDGFARRRWQWNGVAADRCTIVPDVMLGIVEVLRLVTEPGDSVVVNSPVYAPFYAFIEHSGRSVLEAPLGPDLRIDMTNLESAFQSATMHSRRSAFVLCNPHNPTGAVHTRAELEQVAELARRYGVRVIADEIHAPLILDGAQFVPYLSVPGSGDAFSLISASKGWNLAGLKAALAIAGEDAVPDLQRMPEEVSHGPSHVGIIAHAAAFNHGEIWLDDLLAGLNANRALLGELLSEHLPAIGYREPEGTYLAWLDCRPLGFTDEQSPSGPRTFSEVGGPAAVFLEKARVALSSGHVFGTGGAGHVRLNFACSPDTLREALSRMGAVA